MDLPRLTYPQRSSNCLRLHRQRAVCTYPGRVYEHNVVCALQVGARRIVPRRHEQHAAAGTVLKLMQRGLAGRGVEFKPHTVQPCQRQRALQQRKAGVPLAKDQRTRGRLVFLQHLLEVGDNSGGLRSPLVGVGRARSRLAVKVRANLGRRVPGHKIDFQQLSGRRRAATCGARVVEIYPLEETRMTAAVAAFLQHPHTAGELHADDAGGLTILVVIIKFGRGRDPICGGRRR